MQTLTLHEFYCISPHAKLMYMPPNFKTEVYYAKLTLQVNNYAQNVVSGNSNINLTHAHVLYSSKPEHTDLGKMHIYTHLQSLHVIS